MADLVFSVPDVVVADIWFVAALDVIQLPTLSDWLTRREAWRSMGALKMQDRKMQDLKMLDQIAGDENAGPENAGPNRRA